MKPLCFLSLSILLAAIIAPSTANAELKLGSPFGDNMVLQRGMDLNIWGWADAGADVTIKLRDQSVVAKANDTGKWNATLQPIKVGDAFAVTVDSGTESIKIENCLAGEVWICSGQSNMEWPVAASKNFKEEAAAADFPNIRHMKVINKTSFLPKDSAETTGWSVCSAETVGNYTAVGYYFARELHQKLGVPVGLINTSWGGTIVETWTSGESLSELPDFKAKVEKIVAAGSGSAKASEEQKRAAKYVPMLQATMADRSEDNAGLTGDVADWKEVNLPHRWEEGKVDIDGVGWYRRTVTIPDGWVGKKLLLSLAKIDDADETYINGTKVGEDGNWDADRRYKIDASVVTEKELSIAVRVADGHMGGGFHGSADDISLSLDGVAEAKPIQLAGNWRFKHTDKTIALGPRPSSGFGGPNHPTLLYNAMVKPLIPVTFRGAIWYQGESNAGRAFQYRTLFPLLIKDWRKQWNKDFPFYWVQLANFMEANSTPTSSNWAELREAQSMTLSLPNSGQAVIIDIGEAADIHPKNKQDVGKRLALIALAKDYHHEIVFSGPVYKSMSVGGDGKVTLVFDNAKGLMAKDAADGTLQRFEVAGDDQKFVFANAKVVGENVIVSHPEVKTPTAVRYAWSHNPEGCNLYNGAGLPASPFRTDSWPGVTDKNK